MADDYITTAELRAAARRGQLQSIAAVPEGKLFALRASIVTLSGVQTVTLRPTNGEGARLFALAGAALFVARDLKFNRMDCQFANWKFQDRSKQQALHL